MLIGYRKIQTRIRPQPTRVQNGTPRQSLATANPPPGTSFGGLFGSGSCSDHCLPEEEKESQRRFWARFGVTQSRGSRFESGAEIPAPVSILLGLYFMKTVSDADLGRAERVMYSRDAAALLNPGQ